MACGSEAMFYASDVNDTARLDKVEYLLLREAKYLKGLRSVRNEDDYM